MSRIPHEPQHPNTPRAPRAAWRALRCALLCPLLTWAPAALAQPPAAAGAPASLKQAFDAAWARQPEARSLALRRDAAAARRQIAEQWTAGAPSLELSDKSDRLAKNQGSHEVVAGLSVRLWLPDERARSAALADAEGAAVDSRASAAQLRTAAAVRDAWWDWQRARSERTLAQARLDNAQRLAADVAKRVAAGDLARADQHQAAGAAAGAEAALAESASALAATAQRLRGLTGMLPDAAAAERIAPAMLPTPPAERPAPDAGHPALRELSDRAELARRAADLANAQTRDNPELLLATTRDRGNFADAAQQTFTFGVRIPFGSESRYRARVGQARAEALESEELLRLEQDRLAAELDAAHARVAATQTQLQAADKRAELAREARGFFEKSFRLGETDLPTRLRIELEAFEAERQATRVRIDLAAAVSALRQALGLLPEQQ